MIFERVRQIAADIFLVPIDEITPSSTQSDIKTWNSVRHLNLILAVEEEFGLMFEQQDLQQVTTLGELSALIESKLARLEKFRTTTTG